MQAQPYLFFEGRAEEAAEFYRRTVGAEVTTLMRWKDVPDLGEDPRIPADRNKVMHMSLRIGDTTVLASDGGGMGGGSSRGLRWRSPRRTTRRPSGCLPRWPRAARCRRR